jgi:transposase
MTIDGATDAEIFHVYVEQVLPPTRRPGDIVMMDNLRAPKAAGLLEAVAHAAAQVRYLPPYSPDLSPLERYWSTLKAYWRTANARTRGALDETIAAALVLITEADARGWFAHAG